MTPVCLGVQHCFSKNAYFSIYVSKCIKKSETSLQKLHYRNRGQQRTVQIKFSGLYNANEVFYTSFISH